MDWSNQYLRKPLILNVERVKGIEPSSSAWKAVALPLSYTRTQGQVTTSEQSGIARPSDDHWL
jgi:hypothetical protein